MTGTPLTLKDRAGITVFEGTSSGGGSQPATTPQTIDAASVFTSAAFSDNNVGIVEAVLLNAGGQGDIYLVTASFAAPLVLASAGPVYVGILNPAAGGAANFTHLDLLQMQVSTIVQPHAYTVRDTHNGAADYTTLPDPLTIDSQDANAPNFYYFRLVA